MKIITYQHKKVVDYLKKHGEYKVTNKSQMKTLLHLTRPYSGEMFTEAYDYMFNRMNKKIKNQRDHDGDIIAPIWGWYKCPNQSEQDYNNKHLYRITLEIKDSKVLLSDFGDYENFACAGLYYIYYHKKEHIAEELYQREKIEGKEPIYKVYDKMINKKHLKNSEYIQATFYKIKMSDVISIEKVVRDDWKNYRGPYYQTRHPRKL